MLDIQEIKNKIVSILKTEGPSLPVKIARMIEMSPVFASAILSELLNEKRIKTSNLRIGASKLYLVPGQEKELEKYIGALKTVEKEALELLKNEKVLEDEAQEPAIRIALRSIKDFAIPFKKQEKVMWRYSFNPSEETIKPLEETNSEEKLKEKTQDVLKLQVKPIKKENPEINNNNFESPFSKTEKTEFYNEVKTFLNNKKIQIIEEIQIDKKEIVARISINSDLDKIDYLLIAKNKKSVTEDEIKSSIQRAIYHQMPCLYIIRKEPTKKIQKLLEKNNLIKLRIMEQ